ncbi:hypothetical protein Taro_038755 [Colocasia esculenta]|uniref:Uncharacterized protein n=1 Tax=Colocasia esculenta TaxID=4460 RepID=A0A843WPJ1_COLES|nr:hypothetical protein [Colocasia esculenta]
MLRSKLLRLRGFQGAPPFRLSLFPDLKRKVSNSVSAVQDTYLSTKQIFERHRVVFTISTSLASLLTAWAGAEILRHAVLVLLSLSAIMSIIDLVPLHFEPHCIAVPRLLNNMLTDISR